MIPLNDIQSRFGWSLAGCTGPDIDTDLRERFENWLEHKKGPQLQYLQRRKEERLDPKKYFPEVQSILCFGLYYFPGWAKGEVKVSNYSWGEDYHVVLKRKLEETAQFLQAQRPNLSYRICVDTSPVLEKYWAAKAGLGWIGKNTLLLSRKFGSLVFLGEIMTNLSPDEFIRPALETDHCGTCRRCIEACPTDALTPYTLDAQKCISYWTLDHRGEFSDQTPDWTEWVAGCDICQEVCPWNQKLIPMDRGFDQSFQKLETLDIQNPSWNDRIAAKAIDYLPMESWTRNMKHLASDID